MMKKIFIVGLIVCSFFVVSVSTVIAINETRIINDITGDVFDYISGENVSYNPNINVDNIDITKLTYYRQGTSVTLTLEVKGIIENKGHLSDLDADETNVILYSMVVSNSNDSYTIYYVTNECQITYESEEATENITASSFSGAGSDLLTVSFNLLNNDETYDGIYAETTYYRVNLADESYDYLYDVTPDNPDNIPEINVTVDAPSKGEVGQPIQFVGSESGGESPFSWSWDFGDKGTAATQNATHTFDAAKTYEVFLSVTDTNGNNDTASFNVTISESGTSYGGNEGGNNEESSNSELILFVVIIAIIAIAGTAMAIYIIRR